ncbi:MAG: type II CAAX endopeptidase family protein [Candidatus Acidiferrum sp.]
MKQSKGVSLGPRMEGNPFGAPQGEDRGIGSSSGEYSGGLLPKKRGLGAGWRLLVYAAIFFVLWSMSIFLFSQLLRPTRGVFSPSYEFFGESASFLATFLAAWIMSQFEERPVGAYGLPGRGAFGKMFGEGCFFGLCEICALVGLIAAFGRYSFGSLAEHGTMIAKWAFFWGIFFVVVGLFEEFFFRGYSLYTLAEGIGFWPAAVLLSVCFGAVHLENSGEGWLGVAGVALVGLFWSFTLKRTGSLWFAVGMHAAFDFGETFLFSVPDSGMIFPGHLSNASLHGADWLTGGTVGPEASIFDFLILAFFFYLVHRLYPAKEKQGGGMPVG